jgi:hypothetical protein
VCLAACFRFKQIVVLFRFVDCVEVFHSVSNVGETKREAAFWRNIFWAKNRAVERLITTEVGRTINQRQGQSLIRCAMQFWNFSNR